MLLDAILGRIPWDVEAQSLWDLVERGIVMGHVLSSSVTDVYYSARKQIGPAAAHRAVGSVIATFDIAPVHREDLVRALAMRGHDFEDDLQIAVARRLGVDAIVTRDLRGFRESDVQVWTPEEALTEIEA